MRSKNSRSSLLCPRGVEGVFLARAPPATLGKNRRSPIRCRSILYKGVADANADHLITCAVTLPSLAITLVFFAVPGSSQSVEPSDPAKGFRPNAAPSAPAKAVHLTPDARRIDPASPVAVLPFRGIAGLGTDLGYYNVGVIFGAKIYADTMVQAIELYYYVPSNPDNLYREGDLRGATGRIAGGRKLTDNGAYYCPQGFGAVGFQGNAGLAVDRFGLVCGKIGDFSQLVALPIWGGPGGNPYSDNCSSIQSLGLLTGLRVRWDGNWMSLHGLCQAGEQEAASEVKTEAEAKPEPEQPSKLLPDDRATSVAVGASRAEVLKKLGEPYSKITSDSELFLYQLQSGGTLRIELVDGRVSRVQGPGGR